MAAVSAILVLFCSNVSSGFILHRSPTSITTSTRTTQSSPTTIVNTRQTYQPSSSALNVWWFGGTEQSEINNNDDDSCELVAVRIERTSPNSRRIAGEISVPRPLDSVWSILTDYNRLSIHVPNLMESRVVKENSSGGRPGDGSYRCRLYQVGAQKIIGFDFSASVTMDMTERVVASSATPTRKIGFKCVDSQFFSEFDGAWTVKEQRNPATGEIETLCSYVVDVRPKGPVPVAALEWRIREDVPTNLRAVKAATMAMDTSMVPTAAAAATTAAATPQNQKQRIEKKFPVRITKQRATAPRLASVLMDWDVDETMAKYL